MVRLSLPSTYLSLILMMNKLERFSQDRLFQLCLILVSVVNITPYLLTHIRQSWESLICDYSLVTLRTNELQSLHLERISSLV